MGFCTYEVFVIMLKTSLINVKWKIINYSLYGWHLLWFVEHPFWLIMPDHLTRWVIKYFDDCLVTRIAENWWCIFDAYFQMIQSSSLNLWVACKHGGCSVGIISLIVAQLAECGMVWRTECWRWSLRYRSLNPGLSTYSVVLDKSHKRSWVSFPHL